MQMKTIEKSIARIRHILCDWLPGQPHPSLTHVLTELEPVIGYLYDISSVCMRRCSLNVFSVECLHRRRREFGAFL
jgi:hypothetical protein